MGTKIWISWLLGVGVVAALVLLTARRADRELARLEADWHRER